MSNSDRHVGELLQQLGRLGLGESRFLDGQVAVDLKRAEQRAVDVCGLKIGTLRMLINVGRTRTCSSVFSPHAGVGRDAQQSEIGDCRASFGYSLAARGGRRADLEVGIRIVLHVVGGRGVHLAARFVR